MLECDCYDFCSHQADELFSLLFTTRTESQFCSHATSPIRPHVLVGIESTLDKQVAILEQGSKNTVVQSGGMTQARALHYIAWTKVTPSTGSTPASSELSTPKGHAKQSKHYGVYRNVLSSCPLQADIIQSQLDFL